LGTITGKNNTVWAECRFVDPVADIAVLDGPDDQEYFEEAEAYDALVDDAPALPTSSKLTANGWVLTLDCKWVQMPLRVFTTMWGTSLAIGFTEAGMSGSPILNDQGKAIGVVAIGGEIISNGERKQDENQGPQPILARNLPGWLLK
jgi:hypothetical protein